MKKTVLTSLVILASLIAEAKDASYYLEVSGKDVLVDHYLNQYNDDVEIPPQAYQISLPAGYSLMAADVKSDGWAVCGVADYSREKKTLKFEGYDIETDSGSCTLTLTLWDVKNKKELKAKYEIVQVGT